MNNYKNLTSNAAIPIAIASDDEIINIEFKYEYGVTLISGKPGSGKSTIVRQIITYMSKNKEQRPYEVFLADTTGYEFAKPNDLPHNIIKGSLVGAIEKDIREFLDMLYAEFVRKRDAMTNNNCYNVDMSSISIVLIDDIYILLENITSQKYIDKFLEVITTGWLCGFRFVFFCQDYHYAYMKLPMIVREMIGQKIHLSPYKKKDIIEFIREDNLDDEIDGSEERFSVIIKKKDKEHLEKGRLFI